ncbi:MAG: glycosyltransferase 87 family protein, partial [Solirubrobacteraceae bacterium]
MSMPKLMLLRLRENAPWIGFAGLCTVLMAWLGLYGFAWTDYEEEARPAFEALVHGHIASFLNLAPAYGGSLVLRAPFALMTDLWGGGELAVYRMVALPCLLAAIALGIYLVSDMRSRGRPALWRAIVLGVCVANPLTLQALEQGHPEELLGGVLCVTAVLLAYREQPLWAGLVLGAAIANKEWALLAIGPVLMALPARRWLCLMSAGASSALLLGPLLLVSAGRFATGVKVAAVSAGELFHPWQVWWFLGTPNHVTASPGTGQAVNLSARLGWRIEPSWLTGLTHPLIIAVALPLTMLACRRRKDPGVPLLLLSLLLLMRCMLDTW